MKNCEGLEILCCLQANKLACHSLVEADRGLGTPGSETEDIFTHSTAGSMCFMFASVPCPQIPNPMGAMQSSPGGCCTQGGLVSQPRNSELRKSSSLLRDCQQTCPTFAPQGRLHVLYGKQICPCLGGRLFLSSKAVCYTNIFERVVNKLSIPHHKTCGITKRPMEIYIPIIIFFSLAASTGLGTSGYSVNIC